MVLPKTLKILPSVASPTGTLIGFPVLETSCPRIRPSVEESAIARTAFPPIWVWTSAMIVSFFRKRSFRFPMRYKFLEVLRSQIRYPKRNR